MATEVVTPIERIIFKYKPNRAQAPFHASDAKVRGIFGGSGSGKALSLDTPLTTPSGWTTMGKVKVGGTLYDEKGVPCTVIFATNIQHNRPCYKVIFDDGNTIIADADHLWSVDDIQGRKARKRWFTRNPKRKRFLTEPRPRMILDTETISRRFFFERDSKRNYSIDLAKPLSCYYKQLPIDPYVIGAWLGDGSKTSAWITGIDEEIFDEIRKAGYEVNHKCEIMYGIYQEAGKSKNGRDSKNQFYRDLKSLNVLNNKHIPDKYLRGSYQQRLELLQGLMDTDGYADCKSEVEFCNTNKRIAEGVLELFISLGIKATMRTGRSTIYGKDCGEKYRVTATVYDDTPVFRMERKRNRLKPRGKQSDRVGRRFIVGVEPIESVPVKCIQVDSPSHLFLAGSGMIPTHNTRALTAEALIQAMRYPNNEVIISRDVLADLKRTTKRSFLEETMPPELFALPEVEWRESEQRMNFKHNGSAIQFMGLDKPGRAGSTNCGCWIVDEAHLLGDEMDAWYKAIVRQVRRHDTQRSIVLGGHPQGRNSWLHRRFITELDPDWAFFPCNPEDNRENLPPGYLENLHKELSSDPLYLNRYYYGKWEEFEGTVLCEFDEKKHICEPFVPPKHWTKYRGMDYGLNSPSTCLWAAVDPEGMVYFYDEWGGRNMPIGSQVQSVRMKTGMDTIDLTLLDGRSAGRREQTNSGLITIAEQYRLAGLPVVPSATGKAADVEAGLLMMKGLLAADRMKIMRQGLVGNRQLGCPNLIREMFGLVYAPIKEGANANDKYLGSDHYIDAARYIVCRHFGMNPIGQKKIERGSIAWDIHQEVNKGRLGERWEWD